MPSSCKELREALAQCLQESDCVMVHRNTAAECLRPPLADTLPTKCQQLKKGFGECKRGMVDMRKRFRGNMPVAYKTIADADADADASASGRGGPAKGYQLYAGRTAFSGGKGATDGNEPAPKDWREVENEEFRRKAAEQQGRR